MWLEKEQPGDVDGDLEHCVTRIYRDDRMEVKNMDRRGKLVRQITREREAIRLRLRMMVHSRASANGFLNGEESPVGDSESALELAQQEVLIDQEMRAYERLASRAKALEQAWESFQRGTYGICRQCRGQIPQRRLEALPGAALCLSCQEQEEQPVGGASQPGAVVQALGRNRDMPKPNQKGLRGLWKRIERATHAVDRLQPRRGSRAGLT